MKYIIGLVAILLPVLSACAQETSQSKTISGKVAFAPKKEIDPFYIGDRVPDLPLKNVFNYKDSVANLSSFGDKIIILDFWNIYCTSCIHMFPLEDSLQEMFPNDEADDIRKQCFFTSIGDGSYFFKGNYTGKANNPTMFTGIATDELYLNRAESYARQGDSSKALADLNTLMSKRINQTDFVPYSLPIEKGLLRLILTERRKELLFRALRWTDLRRLNKEAEFRDTLYRFINGKTYELLPGSDRYTLQIDRNSTNISGLIQNP